MRERQYLAWAYPVSTGLALVSGVLGVAGGSLVIGSFVLAMSVSVFACASVYQMLSRMLA